MVTNVIPTDDIVAATGLGILYNQVEFAKTVNTDYEVTFAKGGSAQQGNSVRVKIPPRYNVQSGNAANPQDSVTPETSLVLTNKNHIATQFDSEQMTLDVDSMEDYLKPAISQLASFIDQAGLETVIGQTVSNSKVVALNGARPGAEWVVTPGALVNGKPAQWTGSTLTSVDAITIAGAVLTDAGAPNGDNRHFMASPYQMANITNGNKILFNDQDKLSKFYTAGQIKGRVMGFLWHESPNVPRFTNSVYTGTSQAVTTTSAQGATTISLKGFGSADTLLQGTQFNIAGVWQVNPQNRKSVGRLQVFTVVETATNDGSGNFANVKIYPPIYSASQALATVDALPQANAAVSVIGTSAVTTDVGVAYDGAGITLAVVPLSQDTPGATSSVITDEDNNFSIRMVRQYDGWVEDATVTRWDVLFGYEITRPELVVRVQA